jgi:hypothetical protein
LFKARNTLVHPPTRKGIFPDIYAAEDQTPYEPTNAARFIIEVAHAELLLYPLRGDQALPSPAKRIWEQRAVIKEHVDAIGREVSDIPAIDAEPLRDLMAQMIERSIETKRRSRGKADQD